MLFAIAKAAVESQIDHIARRDAVSADSIYPQVRDHLARMSAQWYSGDVPLIEYGDACCRSGYVYAHVPANSNLCLDVLRKLMRAGALVRDDQLRVVAFGGGPGTELLALAKLFAEERERDPAAAQVDVEVEVIDYTNEWSESINAIKRAIREEYAQRFGKKHSWPMAIEANFTRLDFLNARNFANMPSLFQCDVLVLNYVLSELGEKAGALTAVLRQVFDAALKPRALLVIDRRDDATRAAAARLVAELRIQVVGPYDIDGRMDSDERLDELGHLKQRIGRSPRMKSSAFWLYGGRDKPVLT